MWNLSVVVPIKGNPLIFAVEAEPQPTEKGDDEQRDKDISEAQDKNGCSEGNNGCKQGNGQSDSENIN